MTRAVCYAANNGADVIAIGGGVLYNTQNVGGRLDRLQEAIAYARDKKVMTVAGAGECGTANYWCPADDVNLPIYPAVFPQVIGVQSFGANYQLRPYASFGDWVDLAAPGEGFETIWRQSEGEGTHWIDSNYMTPSELAAAHVAGVIAVIMGLNPGFGPYLIEKQLYEAANRTLVPADEFKTPREGGLPRSDRFGYGVLNLERAVEDMPWENQLGPPADKPSAEVVQFVDRSGRSSKVRLYSTNLNEGRWEVTSDKAWLHPEGLPQSIGDLSQIAVRVDVDLLQREQGNLMAGSTVFPDVKVHVINPDNPVMADQASIRDINYKVIILDKIWQSFLPSALR